MSVISRTTRCSAPVPLHMKQRTDTCKYKVPCCSRFNINVLFSENLSHRHEPHSHVVLTHLSLMQNVEKVGGPTFLFVAFSKSSIELRESVFTEQDVSQVL